jgi:hypothetical protein
MNKVAAALAFVIGMMAVFSGGQVLLGKVPDYNVIDWLPLYNYTAGVLSAVVTALLIWTNHRFARPAALATFLIHAIIMIILQTAYRDVVAVDSLIAMTLRLTTWFIILTLMFVQVGRNRSILQRG